MRRTLAKSRSTSSENRNVKNQPPDARNKEIEVVTNPQFPGKLIRPLVRKLNAYVPGEQPKIKRLIKLNTNENPYPPSPRVLRAVRAAVDGRLRLYPNPTAERLRAQLK